MKTRQQSQSGCAHISTNQFVRMNSDALIRMHIIWCQPWRQLHVV